MLYDCFLYFNEPDLLELRMRYLWDYVDYFVIAEGDRAFQGFEKPYRFLEQRERFEWAMSKIRYIAVKVDPTWDPRGVEGRQRIALVEAYRTASDDDIIILGDIDEIPKIEALDEVITQRLFDAETQVTLRMDLFYFYLNNQVYFDASCKNNAQWNGSMVMRKEFAGNPHQTRNCRNIKRKYYLGGWHFCFCQGPVGVRQKLDAFCHAAGNKPDKVPLELLEQAYRSPDTDVWRTGWTHHIVETPECVDVERFKHMIYGKA